MDARTPELRADLTARLRRIEGQVRGVQRMIDEDRACLDILQQMAAIRSATYQASLILVRAYMAGYLAAPAQEDSDAVLDKLVTLLGKLD